MDSSLNIFQRMAAITSALQTVAKNLNVDTGGGKSYKAVSERDIIDAVKPLECEHGVYSYPAAREVLESQMLENETSFTDKNGNTKTTKKTTFFTRIKTVYRFVNIDDPEDFIETTTFAEGIDTQDKGSGKGMTYGDKYALMKAYKISTGDDPDQTGSEETHYTRKAPARMIPKDARPDINAEPEYTPAGEFVPTCAECGVKITDREHDYSCKRYGRPLCRTHQREAST